VLAAWLLLVQAAGPLVGDTVWIDRTVTAQAGSLLRPIPWDPGEKASLLGPPVVEVQTNGWILRYPLVFWEAGRHRLVVPGPLVIRQDGRTDSLPARTVEVDIASLVPASQSDTTSPRPAAELLPAGERTLQPVVVLLLLGTMVLVPVHWWWRRRGPPMPRITERPASGLPGPDLLARWEELGEWRVVADTWIARLEGEARGEEADRLVTALRAARYGSADAAELEALCREAAAR
jgi:hypothetical protein